MVDLIAITTTTSGLTVKSEIDTQAYGKGIKVTKAEMDSRNIQSDTVHPEWSYAIAPRRLT